MLEGLIERVERAAGPSFDLEMEIFRVLHGDAARGNIPPAYTAQIDRALALVPDGWAWMTGCAPGEGFFATLSMTDEAIDAGAADVDMIDVHAATPALALCAASLRARASS